MNRRTFLCSIAAGTAGILLSSPSSAAIKIFRQEQIENPLELDAHVRDYLAKIEYFDRPHPDDFHIDEKKIPLLKSTRERLDRVQRTIGYGFFALISIDRAIKIASGYPSVGSFTKEELDFMEMLFYRDGALYGFLGEKPLNGFTDTIPVNKAIKIPRTGNYLFKGKAAELYETIKQKIGPDVILTSGIRSVTKQFLLFLNKAVKCDGNLSMASRSLAPPGYSYHAVGDFDVGQVGFGLGNFSSKFTETRVFKDLVDSGFATLRYTRTNTFGVRFEPWHIKVA